MSGPSSAAETLGVRAGSKRGGGPKLGEVEEDFAATLRPGDTFLIGGEVVRFEGLREMTWRSRRRADRDPKIAVFGAASCRPPPC
jgi:ATP-dependent Lhr-like helicase